MGENSFLPPTLAKMVLLLHADGRALDFTEIVAAAGPRINSFRHLLHRGLIKDVVKPYQPDEPWTGPRFAKYVLTLKGIKAARILKAEEQTDG